MKASTFFSKAAAFLSISIAEQHRQRNSGTALAICSLLSLPAEVLLTIGDYVRTCPYPNELIADPGGRFLAGFRQGFAQRLSLPERTFPRSCPSHGRDKRSPRQSRHRHHPVAGSSSRMAAQHAGKEAQDR
jgi:hypothetical protein